LVIYTLSPLQAQTGIHRAFVAVLAVDPSHQPGKKSTGVLDHCLALQR